MKEGFKKRILTQSPLAESIKIDEIVQQFLKGVHYSEG
jgi:hypothetical protein